MSKVLVDRELLELLRNFTFLHDDGCAGALRGNIDKALVAQPAEAEGVEVVGYRVVAGSEMLFDVYEEALRYTDEEEPEPLMTVAQHLAALSAVTAERDRLESTLIQTTARHFAQQWKDRADDKKLDECLSEGIAMLEAERDRLRAVLEGAQYPNIDRLKTLTIEQCRQVGETVMRLTIDAQSERDQLRAEVDRLRHELAGKPLVC